ncbi:MAG: zinc-binding alcohol dehydrogenase [Defluviitaleaceae bacterium]|nr:zinc-binding alcohol dehydrogenase [Defluviitaleaceae bacterium]
MLSKYVSVTGVGEASIQTEEVDISNLSENEAVIEAEFSMISAGTELSRVFAIKKGFSYPVRPGYSSVGKVIAKGSGLKDIEIGDRVYYSGPHASVCRIENGEKTQGTSIFKMEGDISPKLASLYNLGLIAVSSVAAGEIKPGDSAAVFGLGAIGLLVAALYKEMGLRVIGVDPAKTRCKIAENLGISECVDTPPDKQVEEILKMTGGLGADICADVTGDSRAIANAVFSAQTHGQVILMGTPRADIDMNVTKVFNRIHMNMLSVRGAFNNLYPLRSAEGCRISVTRNLRYFESLLEKGRIDANKIISHVIKPDEIQEAYHGLMSDKENYLCVVIDWSK